MNEFINYVNILLYERNSTYMYNFRLARKKEHVQNFLKQTLTTMGFLRNFSKLCIALCTVTFPLANGANSYTHVCPAGYQLLKVIEPPLNSSTLQCTYYEPVSCVYVRLNFGFQKHLFWNFYCF